MQDDEFSLPDFEITDYNYIASAIGNAIFSGLKAEQIWQCITLSNTPQELDAAIAVTIRLKRMLK